MSAAFAQAVGGRVAHVTAACNVDRIRAQGLKPAAQLAHEAGIDPATLALRADRVRVGDALLNHQRPIVRGIKAARAMLDGHTPESWAAQLDARVFLWPAARLARFRKSIARDVPIAVVWMDAQALVDAAGDRIDLSPLNSGNFTQGGAHARRGDWLYVPLRAGLSTFRGNRQRRGLVSSPDTVREVSVRSALPAALIEQAQITHG